MTPLGSRTRITHLIAKPCNGGLLTRDNRQANTTNNAIIQYIIIYIHNTHARHTKSSASSGGGRTPFVVDRKLNVTISTSHSTLIRLSQVPPSLSSAVGPASLQWNYSGNIIIISVYYHISSPVSFYSAICVSSEPCSDQRVGDVWRSRFTAQKWREVQFSELPFDDDDGIIILRHLSLPSAAAVESGSIGWGTCETYFG